MLRKLVKVLSNMEVQFKDKVKDILISLLLISLSVVSRVVFFRLGVAVNIELVTVTTLLAGTYLGFGAALAVPLAIMLISDCLIGNTSIYLFTWSAYLLLGLLSYLFRKVTPGKLRLSIFWAMFSSIFFYLWTNFGVWFQGWYPSTWKGLLNCYLMGLPFLKYNLVGNLLLVPLGFGIAEFTSSVHSKLPGVSIIGNGN